MKGDCNWCGCVHVRPRVVTRDGRRVHVLACGCGCTVLIDDKYVSEGQTGS